MPGGLEQASAPDTHAQTQKHGRAAGAQRDVHAPTAGPEDLLHLQHLVGNRAVAQRLRRPGPGAGQAGVLQVSRQVDTGQVAPIKKELDSVVYVSNSTLEELWARLGTQLPEAIADPAYKDLWDRSVNKEKIDPVNAARPLLSALATDTVALSRSTLSSQVTRLENLAQDLQKAKEEKAKQNRSTMPANQSSSGGVEDKDKLMSRDTTPKPLADAGNLVDAATVVDFLENWPDILRGAQVGVRRTDTSLLAPPGAPPATAIPNLLPGPGSPAAQPDTGVQLSPIMFGPDLDVELERKKGGEVDDAALGGGFLQLRQEGLDHAHRAGDVEVDLLLPLAELLLADRAGQHQAGVVEDQVGGAELAAHRGGGGFERRGVGDVGDQRQGIAKHPRPPTRRSSRSSRPPGEQRDLGAALGQQGGRGAAHAAGRPGDDGDAAGQILVLGHAISPSVDDSSWIDGVNSRNRRPQPVDG